MKIVSKYQMAGDDAEIDGDRLKEICVKFAMKKQGASNENGIAPSENELSSKEEKTDASVDGAPSRPEGTAAHAPIDGVASGENCNAPVENTEQQPEKTDSASGQNATGRWQNTSPISRKSCLWRDGKIRSGQAKSLG